MMRYAKISAEGDYQPPPPANAKAAYATMVYVRATIVEDAGWVLARAATIAVSASLLQALVKIVLIQIWWLGCTALTLCSPLQHTCLDSRNSMTHLVRAYKGGCSHSK